MAKKIDQKVINYVEYLCDMLPKILKDYNNQVKENEYLFASPTRAQFDRLRIEMNKTLLKIKKEIYQQ